MPEWSNGADSKSVVPDFRDRGFESLFLRKTKSLVVKATGLLFLVSLLRDHETGKAGRVILKNKNPGKVFEYSNLTGILLKLIN